MEIREQCEEDTGEPRACCGSRQLGPHRDSCRLTPSMQNGMADHEQMYAHEAEVPRGTVTVVSSCRFCHQLITRAEGTADPWRILPDRVAGTGPPLRGEAVIKCGAAPDGRHHSAVE